MRRREKAAEKNATLAPGPERGESGGPMNATSALQSRNVLNAGDLLRASVRGEILARVPTWLQSDGHGGRYVHPAGKWAEAAFAAASSTPRDPRAPGDLLHRVLAEWEDRTIAPGGLAIHERMARILGVSPEQRVVEFDPTAVAGYPASLGASARVGRVEEHLDWLLPAGGPTVLVLDPYNFAGRRAREIALAAATDPVATAARFDSYLQPETVAAAVDRLRACGDGVMLVFATTDREAGEQTIEDLRTDLAAWVGFDSAMVCAANSSPCARPVSARRFAVGLAGVGSGSVVVRQAAGLGWDAAWFVFSNQVAGVAVADHCAGPDRRQSDRENGQEVNTSG